MTVTPIGFIVIGISLAIFVLKPGYLVLWAILVSPFQAASVFNVEGGFPIGIAPFFFVSLLIAFQFMTLWLSGKLSFSRGDIALRISRPLLLLTMWSVASAFILPKLFAGVGVDTPRGGMDSPYTVPLQWTMSNAAQATYMVLNSMFIVLMIWQSSRRFFELAVWAFIGSGVLATLVASWQLIAHYGQLPYPADFFNSNVAWKQLFSQHVAGVWRLSGSFTEPSVAGSFFAIWCTFLLFMATQSRSAPIWAWPMLLCGTTMLVLTASTTGYLLAGLVMALFVLRELRRMLLRGKLNITALACLIVAFCALAAIALYNHDAARLFNKLILEKQESASARDRLTTILQAITISFDTYGLGAGLGSNRPSGMLFYVLSNIGVPGLLLFSWFLYATGSAAIEVLPTKDGSHECTFLSAACWAFAVETLAMAGAGGDMSGPFLWICWALVATGTRSMWVQSQEPSRSRERPDGEIVVGANVRSEQPFQPSYPAELYSH